jgi:L-alanine-DL-glutamate epimerase-like enolase superfamily enzyme
MSAFDMLELQFDESPLFHGLVGDALPALTNGVSAVPAAPGLGVRLTADVLAACLDGPPCIVEPT